MTVDVDAVWLGEETGAFTTDRNSDRHASEYLRTRSLLDYNENTLITTFKRRHGFKS